METIFDQRNTPHYKHEVPPSHVNLYLMSNMCALLFSIHGATYIEVYAYRARPVELARTKLFLSGQRALRAAPCRGGTSDRAQLLCLARGRAWSNARARFVCPRQTATTVFDSEPFQQTPPRTQ